MGGSIVWWARQLIAIAKLEGSRGNRIRICDAIGGCDGRVAMGKLRSEDGAIGESCDQRKLRSEDGVIGGWCDRGKLRSEKVAIGEICDWRIFVIVMKGGIYII